MQINYLIEINGLDDWELTHPIPATAYKLMRKLQYLANKERFPVRVSVPNSLLISMIGCSEDSLIKARNCLIQNGLISYQGRKKWTPVYEIHYFSLNPVYNSKLQSYKQGIEQGMKQGIKQGIKRGIKQGTYINKIRQKKEEEDIPPQEEGARADSLPAREGPLSLKEQRLLMSLRVWLNRASGDTFRGQEERVEKLLATGRWPLELIGEALELTERRQGRGGLDSPADYALALLFDWEEKGYQSLEELEGARRGELPLALEG